MDNFQAIASALHPFTSKTSDKGMHAPCHIYTTAIHELFHLKELLFKL